MASQKKSDGGEDGSSPSGQISRSSSKADIGSDETMSDSEPASSEAPTDDKARKSTLRKGTQGGLGSTMSKRASKARESTAGEGRPSQIQKDLLWAAASTARADFEMPEGRELLRRMKEAEDLESSSSSGGHAVSAKLASPKPGEHHRGIKALHRMVQESEMPMRVAYEQLDVLAANADRVKFAIEKNRSLLTLQVKKTNKRLLRVAFMAWSLEVEYQKHKKLQLRRALTWSIRGLELRAFKGWSRAFKLGKKKRRFEASTKKMLHRRKLFQCWNGWRGMVAEIRRKHGDIRKENRLRKSIEKQLRDDLAKRAAYIMRRSVLRRYFHVKCQSILEELMRRRWECQEEVDARIQARAYLRQILIFLLKKSAFRAFVALRDVARKRAHCRQFIKARFRIMLLKKCLTGWWRSLERNRLISRTVHENFLMHAMFLKWRYLVKSAKYKRRQWIGNYKKLDRKMLHRWFLAYLDAVRFQKCVQGLVARHLQKWRRRLVNRCFQKWISFMQMGALRKLQQVQDFASAMEKENKKLRSDNERLSTIIDSGDWNKGVSVSDLKSAQEVLLTERDALTKIIKRLHQAALDQEEQLEPEPKQLKGQSPAESKIFERNKLLVKGASSFNTLMKIMKHDLNKKGKTAAPATPEVIYEVNNMAMDLVSVCPDGELLVKAMMPRGKGVWSNAGLNSGNTRSPTVISNRPVAGIPLSYVSPKPPRKSSLSAASPQARLGEPTSQAIFEEPSHSLNPKPILREASPSQPSAGVKSPPLAYNKYFREVVL